MTHKNIKTSIKDLERERDVIVQLIKISRDIMGHTHSLQDVWLLAKPSQIFPKRVKKYKSEDDWAHIEKTSTELIDMSRVHDGTTSELLDELLSFVEETRLILASGAVSLPESLSGKMHDFSYSSRMAVLSRVLLQEEGIILPAARFSISQEVIGEQIDSLLASNRELRKHITNKIHDLLGKIKLLLVKVEPSPVYSPWLSQVSNKMEEVLQSFRVNSDWEVLSAGLARIPLHCIPAKSSQARVSIPSYSPPDMPEPKPSQSEAKQRIGMSKKLKIWLNTGWETKWRDIR